MEGVTPRQCVFTNAATASMVVAGVAGPSDSSACPHGCGCEWCRKAGEGKGAASDRDSDLVDRASGEGVSGRTPGSGMGESVCAIAPVSCVS